jgi:alkyl hydroperoxide reductase subunit AhpF
MSLISSTDRERLRLAFADELEADVSLRLSVDEGGSSDDRARQLLTEISSLSSKISLRVVEETVEAPTIELTGRLKGRLRFVGLPLGYELPVFIDAIERCSTGRTTLMETSRERLGGLNADRRVRVFTTPD